MKMRDFNALCEKTQVKLTFKKGVSLRSRKVLDFLVKLFQIDGLYIEVIIDRLTKRIVCLRSFEDTNLLAPYLEEIDLSGILSMQK